MVFLSDHENLRDFFFSKQSQKDMAEGIWEKGSLRMIWHTVADLKTEKVDMESR